MMLATSSAPAAPTRAEAMHGAFRSFVLGPRTTCVGARSAVHSNGYRLGSYAELGSPAATAALARDLAEFVRAYPTIDAPFVTYAAVYTGFAGGCTDRAGSQDPSEQAFERALWAQLQALHDLDRVAWDPSVSADPRDPRFSFSFAGMAFFVVGMHPDSPRVSRRFPWPALIFNPHAQFERLRATGKYERMQKVIRARECALQGDINPALRDHGQSSEARQYSGRLVEADWAPPFQARSTDG